MGNIGLFSSVKNEGPFLLEWVAYHRLCGFDPIVVYSNDSTDGTDGLLNALSHSGILTHICQSLAPEDIPQYAAANLAFDHPAFSNSEWLMWLDADEFLFCDNSTNSVRTLIETVGNQGDAICINWLNFGDSGIAKWRPGLITDRFIHRGPDQASRHAMFKTLFRRSESIRGFGLHRPFLKADFYASGKRFINTAGTTMHNDVYRSGAHKRHALGNAPASLVAHDAAAIFHYAVKSRDSFEAKRARGQGTKPVNASDRSSRFREKYWLIYNQNVLKDDRMLRLTVPLRAEIAKLLADPAVNEAYKICNELYAKVVKG